MTDREPGRIGVGFDVKPHAYDPIRDPELFEGVLPRRILAFMLDVIVLFVPVAVVSVFIFIVGVVTFGLGFALYWLLGPAIVVWAILYYAVTLGGPASATWGMRAMDIELRTWYGAPCYSVLGAVHPVLFWISVSALTPLVLLVGLFNERHRLLHDLVLGTVVINNRTRAAALSGPARVQDPPRESL